jgi:hypothetical protein
MIDNNKNMQSAKVQANSLGINGLRYTAET